MERGPLFYQPGTPKKNHDWTLPDVTLIPSKDLFDCLHSVCMRVCIDADTTCAIFPILKRFVLLCGRRVGKLYRPPGGKQFLCWRCHDLAYLSTRVTADVRLGRRAWGIRQRLGQRDPGQPFPAKPKHMHLKTYNRLRAECMAYEMAGTWLTLELFGLVDPCMLASPEGKCNLTTEVVRQ